MKTLKLQGNPAADLLLIAFGAFIYSFGLNFFLIANGLTEGGFAGISVLLFYIFKFPVGVTYFLVNVPLLVLGWRMFGWDFVAKTVLGVVFVSLFAQQTSSLHYLYGDKLLVAIYAGVFSGVGRGLIFFAGGTTGGVDIIARILRKKKDIQLGQTIFAFDVLVLSLFAALINLEVALYSLVALFIGSRIINFLQVKMAEYFNRSASVIAK